MNLLGISCNQPYQNVHVTWNLLFILQLLPQLFIIVLWCLNKKRSRLEKMMNVTSIDNKIYGPAMVPIQYLSESTTH